MNKAKVTWLGHSSLKIEGNGCILYFDPWIESNPKCKLKLSDITEATAVCVSHGHDDHIGDSIQIAKQTGAKYVCSPELGFYADQKGLKYDEDSFAMNIGGSWETDDFVITMVRADHTSEILGEEFQKDGTVMPGSGAVGFVLRFNDGPSIYYSGDTGVFNDMALIRDLYRPELAICTAGGKYNMGYREAAYAAGLLLADYFIPVHHGTFDNQILDMNSLRAEMKIRAPWVKLISLEPGESFEIGE